MEEKPQGRDEFDVWERDVGKYDASHLSSEVEQYITLGKHVYTYNVLRELFECFLVCSW